MSWNPPFEICNEEDLIHWKWLRKQREEEDLELLKAITEWIKETRDARDQKTQER